jgi:hypothetical protein
MTDLTSQEKAVLREMGKQLSPEDQNALETQLAGASVRNRENTGAGFFTYFNTMAAPKVQADVRGCNVTAKIPNLKYGLGFILWLTDGYMDNLEGYTFGPESTEGMELEALTFELVSGPPFSS